MPATTLNVQNLSAGYGPTRILESISFSVSAGRRLAVLGRNGMGKTTLFATLAGQTRRYDGKILLGNTDISSAPSAARAHAGLGYVPQTRDVFPSLDVEENLTVGLKSRKKDAIEEAYAMFPRLKERRRNLGSQLSGGEQQMLTTARTILGRPSVLLLDEPTNDLDVETLRALENALEDYAGCAIIISHDRWFLDRIATHILAFEGNSHVEWFQGNYSDYIKNKEQRLGSSSLPEKIKYKPLIRK